MLTTKPEPAQKPQSDTPLFLRDIVDQAWDEVRSRSVQVDRDAIDPLRSWLRRQTNPHAIVLTGRRPPRPADEKSEEELMALMASRIARSEETQTTVAQHLILIHRVGRRLRDKGVELAPTRIMRKLRPPASPFPIETPHACNRVEAWRSALEQAVIGLRSANAEAMWAMIAVSVVLNGALIDRTKLNDLRQRLAQGEPLLRGNHGADYAFVEFLMSYAGVGKHHLQRWYCDPVTELLLHHAPAAGDVPSFRSTIPVIQTLLRDNGVPPKSLPRNLTDLMECASIWWAGRSAPVDLHAMQRRVISHDLTSSCWARLKCWSPEEGVRVAATLRGGNSDTTSKEIEDEILASAAAEHEWLIDLMDVVRGDDLPQAQNLVKSMLAGSDKNYSHTYLGWLSHALENPDRKQTSSKLRTLAGPFILAAPRLLNYLGSDPPEKLSLDKLDETYREILDGCETQEPLVRIARGLRMFHAYLNKAFGFPHLTNPRETFGEDGSLMPVDATVVSVDEYLRALNHMEDQLSNGVDPEENEIQRLVIMLAFRTGLRRSEIFGLRLCDVHLQAGIDLQVCPYAGHRLKTRNAMRTVPAGYLLNVHERAWLRSWCARRQAAPQKHPGLGAVPSLLLARSSSSTVAFSIERVVERAMRAIHFATKERRLSLHHLRHSCASWLWLKLRAPDYTDLVPLLSAMPALVRELGTARRLRVQLCGASRPSSGSQAAANSMADSSRSGPSRSYSYIVSSLLGHASPQTTLEHYIHVADLFRAVIVLRQAKRVSATVWQALTQKGRTTSHQWRKDPHGAAVSQRPVKAPLPDHPPKTSDKKPTSPKKTPRDASADDSIVQVGEVLNLYNSLIKNVPTHDGRVAALARKRSLPHSTIERWIKRAHLLAPHFFDIKAHKCSAQEFLLGPVPVPHPYRHKVEQVALDNLKRRFSKAARSSPELMSHALGIVPGRLDRQRSDVKFRGPKDEVKIRDFLGAMHAAGLLPERITLTLRRGEKDSLDLPSWPRAPRLHDLRITRVPPTGRAGSFRRWIGLRLCDPGGGSRGNAWRTGLFLACIALVVSDDHWELSEIRDAQKLGGAGANAGG